MKRLSTILFTAVVAWGARAHAQDARPLPLVQTIALPGVEGRIDHLAADLRGRRLFVAALGNNTVEVLDWRAGRRIHTIAGLHEPQGIGFVPPLNRIFVANGEGGACDVFDGDSFRLLTSIKFSDDADNVRYDAAARRIYVGYGTGSLGIVDPANGEVLGDIALRGHPESFQLERRGPRIFVNVPTASQVAVIDRERRRVTATWPLADAQANFPMALDEARHRLFVGCRKPPRVLVLDMKSGRVAAKLDIAGDTDDLFYDPVRRWILVSCGQGFINVFDQGDADHYEPIGKIATAPGARTSLLVPDLGRLYLAVPHRGGQQAEIRVYQEQPRQEHAGAE